MKTKTSHIFLGVGTVCFLCSAFFIPEKEKSKNWFNTAYLNCLETRLPCDCQEQESPAYLRMDTAYVQAMWADGIIYDQSTYSLHKQQNEYLAYAVNNETEWVVDTLQAKGRLQIIGDTLYFLDVNKKKKAFVRAGKASDDFDQYDAYHVALLNRTLAKYHYPSLEKTVGNDSLLCACNAELGLNLVYSKKQFWILEQKKNKVSLYEWINAPEEKTIDPVIEKRLVKQFKW